MRPFLLVVLAGAVFCPAAMAGWVDLGANIPWPTDSIGLHDVQFLGDEGWVLGSLASSARLFHTTDGGATFEMKSLPYQANAMHWVSRQECFIGCQNGFVMRTTSAGDSWTFVGTAGWVITDITFPPTADTGVVCGLDGLLARVTASSVTRVQLPTVSSFNCASFPVSAGEGWVGGAELMVHFLGDSWRYDQHTRYQSITGVSFRNNRQGWYVSNSEGVARTLDGYDWQLVFPDDSALFDVHFCDTLHGWAAGAWGRVVSTTDGGENWQHEPTSSMTDHLLVKVFAVDTGTVYVVGNYRTLLKYTSTGAVEESRPSAVGCQPAATVVASGVQRPASSVLFDVQGRRVTDPKPGVYFVCPASGIEPSASGVTKVVVTR